MNYHLLPHKRGWLLRKSGGKQATRIVADKKTGLDLAYKFGADIIYIYNEQGRIVDRRLR